MHKRAMSGHCKLWNAGLRVPMVIVENSRLKINHFQAIKPHGKNSLPIQNTRSDLFFINLDPTYMESPFFNAIKAQQQRRRQQQTLVTILIRTEPTYYTKTS